MLQTFGAISFFEFIDFSSSPSTNGMFSLTTNGDMPRPIFIPNGMPNTVVPCGTEKNFTNGIMNGHMSSLPDNTFTGYIIAIHRKMVSFNVTIGLFSVICETAIFCLGNIFIEHIFSVLFMLMQVTGARI